MMKKGKKNKELELEYIYNELFDKMVELIIRYDEPQVVASTMMAQAMRLYKTVFKLDSEFREAMDAVMRQSETIEPYNHKTLH